jgi:ATP citrate (pro-S)-lyase
VLLFEFSRPPLSFTSVHVDLHFAYLEINPLVCLDGVNGGQPTTHYLDMAAQLDQTADSICGPKWAITRDLTTYDTGSSVSATQSRGVSADRGPPMVSLHHVLRDLLS